MAITRSQVKELKEILSSLPSYFILKENHYIRESVSPEMLDMVHRWKVVPSSKGEDVTTSLETYLCKHMPSSEYYNPYISYGYTTLPKEKGEKPPPDLNKSKKEKERYKREEKEFRDKLAKGYLPTLKSYVRKNNDMTIGQVTKVLTGKIPVGNVFVKHPYSNREARRIAKEILNGS